MEFGDKEWFEGLNKRVTFPERFIFYYNKKENLIGVRVLESKARVENARWKDVRPSALSFQNERHTAVLQVKELDSDREYYNELVRLQKEWETEPY